MINKQWTMDEIQNKIWRDLSFQREVILQKRELILRSLANARTLEIHRVDKDSLISISDQEFDKLQEYFKSGSIVSTQQQLFKINDLLEQINEELTHSW